MFIDSELHGGSPLGRSGMLPKHSAPPELKLSGLRGFYKHLAPLELARHKLRDP